ncbi:hypothetical protein J1N35_030342 [Gossypium stocksii]|uniref:Uncharacterized protein n=1 Tax=Gossypium stocksii TaxID=47602 RepID=A0A9D3UZ63_9ROSI|nr:hypothetical protein J1N35_030342 [Gossypium stocksii]
MSFTLDTVEELGVPEVLFWTISACGFLNYVHYRQLIGKRVIRLSKGIDMEIKNNAKREKVERLVRELIKGEKGKDMKKKAVEWERKVEAMAVNPDGSSYRNLDKIIQFLCTPRA